MFGIWYPHVNVVSEKGTKQSQIFGCFCELLKIVLFFEFCLKNICVCIYIYIVGSQIVAQTQVRKDMGSINPVQ